MNKSVVIENNTYQMIDMKDNKSKSEVTILNEFIDYQEKYMKTLNEYL